MPGIWTSLTFHRHAIVGSLGRVFRIPLVIAWRPELTAPLTAFPRAPVLILIVGIAPADAVVCHVAPPTPSQRKKTPSHNPSTAHHTAFELTALWRRHSSGHACRQSAGLPSGWTAGFLRVRYQGAVSSRARSPRARRCTSLYPL